MKRLFAPSRWRVALTRTKTEDEFVLCCCGSSVWSQEIVEQHLQAQQLDGGEGGGGVDAGVQAQPRRIGLAVEGWSACNRRRKKTYKLQSPSSLLTLNFSHCVIWSRGLTGLGGGRWV